MNERSYSQPSEGWHARSSASKAGVALLFATFGGFAGAVIGGIVGRVTENPNEMLASLDPIVGAVIGFPIGVVVGLVLFAIWAASQ